MRMDMVITLGNVMQIGATVAAVVVAYYALRERLVRIETQLAPLWDAYTQDRPERRQGPRRMGDRHSE